MKPIWTDDDEIEREALSFYSRLWPIARQRPGYSPPAFRLDDNDSTDELSTIWNELGRRSSTYDSDRLVVS